MSDEQMTRRVTQLIAEMITKSAAVDERRACEVDPAYTAEWMTGAQIKRRIATYLVADGVTPEQVDQAGTLGVTIGPLTLAPPDGASYAQLEAHRDVLREIFDVIVPRINDTHRAMRSARSTLDTVQLDEEDLQPDPLTASPAESTGAHKAVTGAAEDGQEHEHLGHRVLVVTEDGVRSRGVLIATTPNELLLEPCEAGAATIPRADVYKVLRVAPVPADAGIWERGADGRLANRLKRDPEEPRAGYPTEPATARMPGRESVTSGPHRIVAVTTAAAPAPTVTRPEPVPAAPDPMPEPGVPHRPELPADREPSLWRRIWDGLTRGPQDGAQWQ